MKRAGRISFAARLSHDAFNGAQITFNGAQIKGFEEYLRQAEEQSRKARLAARSHRYETARRFYIEAATLYRRAAALDGIVYPQLEIRLTDIEAELRAFPAYVRDEDAAGARDVIPCKR